MDFQVTDELLYKLAPLAAELEMESWTTDFDIPFSPSEKYRRKMRRLLRQSHNPKLHYHYMSAAGRVAVVILAIVLSSVALTVSVKAVMEWRMNVKRVEHYMDYDETHFFVTGGEEDIEVTLTKELQGFTMVEAFEGESVFFYKYQSKDATCNLVIFALNDFDVGFDILGTQGECIGEILRGSKKIQVYITSESIKYIWKENGYVFALGVEGKVQEEIVFEFIDGIGIVSGK